MPVLADIVDRYSRHEEGCLDAGRLADAALAHLDSAHPPTRAIYTARAVRSGRWWAIDVPELDGAFSQAGDLDEIEPMARGAITLLLDVPPDSFAVTVLVPCVRCGAQSVAGLTGHICDQCADAYVYCPACGEEPRTAPLPAEDRYEAVELIVRAGEIRWAERIHDLIADGCPALEAPGGECTCGIESISSTMGTLEECYRWIGIETDDPDED